MNTLVKRDELTNRLNSSHLSSNPLKRHRAMFLLGYRNKLGVSEL